MKLEDNKGSAILLVIIITAALLILGGAMISTISMNYRLKDKESNKVQNLYEAQAGLDMAYNIIAKDFEAGIVAGNYEVNSTIKGIEQRIKGGEQISESKIKSEKEEAFKNGFKKYINNNGSLEVSENENLFKQSFITWDEDKISEPKIYRYVVNKTGNSVEFENIKIKEDIKEKPIIKCEEVKLESDNYLVRVSSKFTKHTSTGDNGKVVEVTYKVNIPDYKSGKSSNIKIEQPIEINSKVIAIDGNMKINGDNTGKNFDIYGDIFVRGNELDDNTKDDTVYGKYRGGIEVIGPQSKVTMKGNVVTSKTFNVNSNQAIINIEKNLYAKNVYIGNKNGTASPQSTISLNNVVIDNDFAVKSNESNITIENIYEINDKNTQSKMPEREYKASSSIIVNNDKNNCSSLTVNNEAYIMGTAYINAKKGEKYYQTGESVLLKDDYIAYIKPIEELKDLKFRMYDSLKMIDKKNGESLDNIEKSQYFKEFVNMEENDEITNGGVSLNREKAHAVGSVVYKEGKNIVVEKANYTKSIDDVVSQKQEDYAKEVYAIGNEDGSLRKLYDSPKQKSILESIIDFTKIKEFVEVNKLNEKLVLNNDSKTIVLSNRNDYKKSPNEILITVGDEVNALVISKGNIKLDGDFQFNGAIIGGGNLEIINRSSKDINYDKNVIENIINNNYLQLTDVFIKTSSEVSDDKVLNNNNIESFHYRYNVKEYVTSKNWKIIKNVSK
ncbi:hypothetical protein [Terrisporobacter sp.]